jgi:uncharacterized YigZ family protein
MTVFSYQTIQSPSTGSYKEKGSKFLAFAYPVETEGAVKSQLEELKKEYYDARHHCFAYVLGPEKRKFRAFDDGEPNHSAGDPILGQIRSKNLTNVLVVVVRYFGGTKLGVGGLITAYKMAAEEALTNAVMVERDVTESVQLFYDYASTPEVLKLVKDFNLTIKDQDFTEACLIKVEFRVQDKAQLMEKIALLKATGVKLKIQKQETDL